MNGSTAQLGALVCALNARCRGLSVVPPFASNSTSQFCAEIQFTREARSMIFGRQFEKVLAESPDQWIELAVRHGVTRASLFHQQVNVPGITDRESAGFVGGGGIWNMLVHKRNGTECWRAHWNAGNRNAPDQKCWHVRYVLVAERQLPIANGRPVSLLIEDLSTALTEIELFARDQALDSFVEAFQLAQKCLVSEDPLSLVYHKDIAPPGSIGLSAARLLAAVQAAWVFHGMGSWNDLAFRSSTQTEYERCSDRLFDLLNEGIVAGINDSGNQVT